MASSSSSGSWKVYYCSEGCGNTSMGKKKCPSKGKDDFKKCYQCNKKNRKCITCQIIYNVNSFNTSYEKCMDCNVNSYENCYICNEKYTETQNKWYTNRLCDSCSHLRDIIRENVSYSGVEVYSMYELRITYNECDEIKEDIYPLLKLFKEKDIDDRNFISKDNKILKTFYLFLFDPYDIIISAKVVKKEEKIILDS